MLVIGLIEKLKTVQCCVASQRKIPVCSGGWGRETGALGLWFQYSKCRSWRTAASSRPARATELSSGPPGIRCKNLKRINRGVFQRDFTQLGHPGLQACTPNPSNRDLPKVLVPSKSPEAAPLSALRENSKSYSESMLLPSLGLGSSRSPGQGRDDPAAVLRQTLPLRAPALLVELSRSSTFSPGSGSSPGARRQTPPVTCSLWCADTQLFPPATTGARPVPRHPIRALLWKVLRYALSSTDIIGPLTSQSFGARMSLQAGFWEGCWARLMQWSRKLGHGVSHDRVAYWL